MPENVDEKNNYQDVINFQPQAIEIVKNRERYRLLMDPDYYLVIDVLKKGPMTIKEIEAAYAGLAEARKNVEPKSYNTIYRYLKTLETADLVAVAGKRIEFGKTASETLFARTARLFLFSESISGENVEPLLGFDFEPTVAETLRILGNKTRVNVECFKKVYQEVSRIVEKEMEKLIELRESEEVLEKITTGDWDQILKRVDIISYFAIMINRPDIVEKIQSCFE